MVFSPTFLLAFIPLESGVFLSGCSMACLTWSRSILRSAMRPCKCHRALQNQPLVDTSESASPRGAIHIMFLDASKGLFDFFISAGMQFIPPVRKPTSYPLNSLLNLCQCVHSENSYFASLNAVEMALSISEDALLPCQMIFPFWSIRNACGMLLIP